MKSFLIRLLKQESGVPMKQTHEEKKQYPNFQPGKITRDGFLGTDTRHIHDIIDSDIRTLGKLGKTKEEIADRLQYFIDTGKEGLESHVDLGDYMVKIDWDRGMLPCPFNERGLHHKIIARVLMKTTGKSICYSQLNVHMIREHGFFEGHGSAYRLDPEKLILDGFVV